MTKISPPTVGDDHHRFTVERKPQNVRLTSTRARVARQKAELLSLFEAGHTTEDSCRLVGISPTSWKYYKSSDQDFCDQANLILARRNGAKVTDDQRGISFEEFSTKYLNVQRFNHQLQWIDMIEGRTPRNLHPSQTYIAGDPDTIIINTPPSHAKSTTITMDYVTYKIVTDPNFRVVMISKTETMAKKFLTGVKRRLTNKEFSKLQADFAPPEGFERASEVWSAKMIYFGHGDSDQKDPNIEALGIGQQIYGARADLIILDDIEDLSNAHQYAAHLDYIMQDVMTRDAPILVVGTRVAPVDIYSELMNPEHYDGESSDWTYLSQPAILEIADDPKDWVTLWPYTDRPHPTHPGHPNEEGLWPKWDGPRLARLRRKVKPATWALVYMQQSVPEDSVFSIEAIHGCQGVHPLGTIPADRSSLYIVAGFDPATVGYSAAVCQAVDRRTGKRYLIDVFNRQLRNEGIRNLISDWTEKYHINEWRIERNAFQAFLTQDREINQFLASRGVRLREHSTLAAGSHSSRGVAKHDPDWGVASLDSLFRGWQDHTALLEIPMGSSEAYKQWKEQLVTWYPNHPKTQKTDLVMAFWFAELGCRDQVKELGLNKQTHLDNAFLSERDLEARVVINIEDYLREQARYA